MFDKFRSNPNQLASQQTTKSYLKVMKPCQNKSRHSPRKQADCVAGNETPDLQERVPKRKAEEKKVFFRSRSEN